MILAFFRRLLDESRELRYKEPEIPEFEIEYIEEREPEIKESRWAQPLKPYGERHLQSEDRRLASPVAPVFTRKEKSPMMTLLEVMTLLNISWTTGPVVGKSLAQIIAEMQTQRGTQPRGSFVHDAVDADVDHAVRHLEEDGFIRVENDRYFVTTRGHERLRYLRPLVQTFERLLSMVGL